MPAPRRVRNERKGSCLEGESIPRLIHLKRAMDGGISTFSKPSSTNVGVNMIVRVVLWRISREYNTIADGLGGIGMNLAPVGE